MTVYRTIQYGERLDDILNEMEGLVFSNNVEYAIVRLADGTRAIVSGGFTGIQFAPGQITRLFLHIHPFGLPAQGPSPGDYQALQILGQISSWLIERGQLIKFTVFQGP